MYLKQKPIGSSPRFILSESFHDGECWRSRELMDLGPDPAAHIVYGGGNSFYIHEDVESTLRGKGARFSDHELETLFLPFLDPRIRRIVERFGRRAGKGSPRRRTAPEELLARQRALHAFDKRRLHYLRCGRTDIGNLGGRAWPFFNVLLDKSRDEIEHLLEEMEKELPPHEIRPYLYTALEVHTHFRHLYTRHQPAALDPEQVDRCFVEDLCRLNRDERFFRGVDRPDAELLHPYLRRYLLLYFDNGFDRHSLWREYAEDFIRKHRFYRPSRRRAPLSMEEEEACRRLHITREAFSRMDRKTLVSRFRQRAKVVHPDKGGDQQAFVELTRAFERLLRKKA